MSCRDLQIGCLHTNRLQIELDLTIRIWIECRIELAISTNETEEMCRTTDSSFQFSNTLNVWSLIELASLYTVPLRAINGLSRLTTTSKADLMAHHFRIEIERPIRIRIKSWGVAGP